MKKLQSTYSGGCRLPYEHLGALGDLSGIDLWSECCGPIVFFNHYSDIQSGTALVIELIQRLETGENEIMAEKKKGLRSDHRNPLIL